MELMPFLEEFFLDLQAKTITKFDCLTSDLLENQFMSSNANFQLVCTWKKFKFRMLQGWSTSSKEPRMCSTSPTTTARTPQTRTPSSAGLRKSPRNMESRSLWQFAPLNTSSSTRKINRAHWTSKERLSNWRCRATQSWPFLTPIWFLAGIHTSFTIWHRVLLQAEYWHKSEEARISITSLFHQMIWLLLWWLPLKNLIRRRERNLCWMGKMRLLLRIFWNLLNNRWANLKAKLNWLTLCLDSIFQTT